MKKLLVNLFLKFISCGLLQIPIKINLSIGSCLGLLWFYIIPIRKKLVLQNMRLAFGGSKTEHEIYHLARNNFKHYGKTFIEFLMLNQIKKDQLSNRVVFNNIELIEKTIREGKQLLFLTAHLGSFESVLAYGSSIGWPTSILVKKIKDSVIDEIITNQREKFGAKVIKVENKNPAKELLKTIRNGYYGIIVFDQYENHGIPTKFFALETKTSRLLAYLVSLRDFVVLPVFSHRLKDGKIVIDALPAIHYTKSINRKEDLHNNTQRFNDCIENYIRQYPEQWFWVHRRWRNITK